MSQSISHCKGKWNFMKVLFQLYILCVCVCVVVYDIETYFNTVAQKSLKTTAFISEYTEMKRNIACVH